MSKKNKKIKTEDLINKEETLNEGDSQVENTDENTSETQELSEENPEESEGDTDENETQESVEEWKDKYIRLYAEFENYKKRTLKEKLN